MIEITVINDKGEQQPARRFEAPRIRIGRGEDNDVVLDSHASSRHHAEIIFEAGSYKIIDLGSTNGIEVGGHRVPDFVLSDGTSVTVGIHTLSFSLGEDPGQQTVRLTPDMLLPPPGAPSPTSAPLKPLELYLVFEQSGRTQSLKIVEGARYVVGRSPDADLILDDRNSSKRHLLVCSEGHRFQVRDLGSSNGTLLNGESVREAPLAVGDQIVVGSSTIRVQEERPDLSEEGVLLGRTRLGMPSGLAAPGPQAREGGEIDPSPRSRRLGVPLAAAAILILGFAAVVLLRGSREEPPEPGVDSVPAESGEPGTQGLIVQVAVVEAKQLATTVEGSGSVSPHQSVTVSAEVSGRVLEISADEGSTIEAGALLVRLNDTDLRLQLEEARSAVSQDRVDLAREDHERKQRLYNDGVVSRAVLDQAKSSYLALDSAYNSAQAKIGQLREQLTKTRITAPISGRVARKFVNPGEFLGPGGPVVTIENMEEVLIELDVSDRDIVKVEPGQAVQATTSAFPGRIFHGVVDSTASAANPVTRTFKVEARIGNRDASLRSGMIASLRIVLEENLALVVPAEALMEAQENEASVLVVTEEIARRRNVLLGRRWDREVEVLAGLEEGQEVVVDGKELVEDGQRIESYRRR